MYKDDRSGFSYRVPDSTDIDSFRQAIEQLPGTESPEVYGLHPNADVTFRTLQVQEAVITILDTMPKGGAAAGGLSREEVVDKICEDLLSKVRILYISTYVHVLVCVCLYANIFHLSLTRLRYRSKLHTVPFNVFYRQGFLPNQGFVCMPQNWTLPYLASMFCGNAHTVRYSHIHNIDLVADLTV